MFEGGSTTLGVATDHVIESFRNDLWPDTKRAKDRARAAGTVITRGCGCARMGVVVWAMEENSRPMTRWPPRPGRRRVKPSNR